MTPAGPLRIGVLGAARISESAIAGPARTLGCRLVAVAARDPDRARSFAAEHGVERVLDDYAQVVADPEVEVVYNPLPNALHGPWNLEAVRAGKHVLTEKPSASCAAEARAVRDAAAEAGVELVEGFHYLHHPLARRLLELAGSGELGRIEAVEVEMFMPAPEPDDPRWSLELAGGAGMDLGCYGLHVHRMLAPYAGGEPAVVAAQAVERSPGLDEELDVQLAFPDGATWRVHSRMGGDTWQFSCRVTGSAGQAEAVNFVLPQRDDRIVVRTAAGRRVEHLGTRSTYTYQLEALVAHLRDGAPSPLDAQDAVATMQLVDDGYRAADLPPRPRQPEVR